MRRAALPEPDARWVPGTYPREELRRALVQGGVAGVEVSHPLDNVLWKIGRLVDGDPDLRFGLSGLPGPYDQWDILGMVADLAGFEPDRTRRHGPVEIDAEHVLATCDSAGSLLARAARPGRSAILATGHPTGLPILYLELGRLLAERGVRILEPLDGEVWTGGRHGTKRSIRYFHGVAMLTTHGSAVHTHSSEAMERMLAEERPDLVVADHGFAGAAIEAGVETVSVADVNDPALIVARALGRTEAVIVMDDNVRPEAYWPCFQAIDERRGADTMSAWHESPSTRHVSSP
jgi:hypothetical protein